MKIKTKIICTIGPASQRKETILKMAEAGMNVARLNFSHGTHEQHSQVIDLIRQINSVSSYQVKILQDLAGYRIRVGELRQPVELIKYQEVWMKKGQVQNDECIPLDFDGDFTAIKKGMDVYINDGKLYLKVIGRVGLKIKLEVFGGERLISRKGVNVPDLQLRGNILTKKDREDIEFGVKNKVDFMAQSFVRNKSDIDRVVKLVKPRLSSCQIVAKIENRQGLTNLTRIMDSCDGIMVARGDLGVSMPIYQIPILQKQIIKRCNERKKFVITATQMLDSMTENARPTRAEVSDVANAILDGTDYVMLSGETAVGSFPVKTVRMMSEIIKYTERNR